MAFLTLGITTYNRLDLIKKLKASLEEARSLSETEIIVIDDCSEDFHIEFLIELFPTAKIILRNDRNLGPDRNMRKMMSIFRQEGADYLMILDSDLIVDPDIFVFLKEQIEKTDGFLSVYNSCRHRGADKEENGDLIVKKTVGAAGSVYSREIACKILDNLPESSHFDWDCSYYLEEIGVRRLVSKRSYVQHIGITGRNCNYYDRYEYALNFTPAPSKTVQFMSEMAQEIVKIENEHKNIKSAILDLCVYSRRWVYSKLWGKQ